MGETILPSIKLMPDYDSWPLWHDGGDVVGSIDPASLDLSEQLANGLHDWAADYDSKLERSDPASTRWTDEEERDFASRGRVLYEALVREIGDRYSIVFVDPFSPQTVLERSST